MKSALSIGFVGSSYLLGLVYFDFHINKVQFQCFNKIKTYLQSLAENDVLEDLLEEKEDPSDSVSSVNRELLRKVAELTEKVEALERQKQFLEAEGRKEVSPSDPDARFRRCRGSH